MPRGWSLEKVILGRISEGVLVADMNAVDHALCYVNEAFTEITGYSSAEALGRNCRYLQGVETNQLELQRIRDALSLSLEIRVRLRNFRKNGNAFWNELHLIPVRKHGITEFFVGIIKDITPEVQINDALREATYIDEVTGLPNRYGFRDSLERISREAAAPTLLIKVNVVRFQDVNAGLGYDLGNELLRLIAKRISGFDTAACSRLGGNEFGLAFANVGREEARVVVDKVVSALAQKFEISDFELHPRFTAGFVVCAPGLSATTMLRQLATAAAVAKRPPYPEVAEFCDADEETARRRLQLVSELRHAVTDEQFIFHYQPKVDLASGRLIGAEALIRWQHPSGLRLPGRFVSLAEETGLIIRIGEWGLRAGAAFAAALQDRTGSLGVSINVSSLQFTNSDLPAYLARVLADTKVDPSNLTLELTESVIAQSTSEMIRKFRRVRDMGVGLSIDDFGTGYSSLRYLESFPITEIKIDRSFVSEMVTSGPKRAMVDSVIRIGRSLNLSVVAEGIETEAERDMLNRMGCRFGQGYLFGKPVSEAEFMARAVA